MLLEGQVWRRSCTSLLCTFLPKPPWHNSQASSCDLSTRRLTVGTWSLSADRSTDSMSFRSSKPRAVTLLLVTRPPSAIQVKAKSISTFRKARPVSQIYVQLKLRDYRRSVGSILARESASGWPENPQGSSRMPKFACETRRDGGVQSFSHYYLSRYG